jgi:hypothetical protein
MLASTRGTAVALNRFLLCRKILFVPLLLCCVPFPANGQITIQGSTPQRPVMAHELTHALQDQNFGLENWIKLEDATGKNLPEIERDDHQAARRAVAEGHATAVMLDYLFAPYNKSLADFPAIESEVLQRAQQVHNTIAVAQAPLFLREASAFPYTYGLEFIHQVLLKAGKERAYSGVFKKPPRSTRQIMEPGTYLADEKIPPMKVPLVESLLGAGYQKLDVGAMGEFEVMVFVKQFGSLDQVKQIAPQWRGGYYYAAQKLSNSGAKSASPQLRSTVADDIPNKTDEVALLYISRWATSAAAREFAEVYRSSLAQRYPGAKQAGVESSPGSDVGSRWNTAEGLVLLRVKGELVVAVEGLDDATASLLMSESLRDAASD